jgi:hypothetical protein
MAVLKGRLAACLSVFLFRNSKRFILSQPLIDAMRMIRLIPFHKYYPQLKAVFYPAGYLQFRILFDGYSPINCFGLDKKSR